MQTAKQMSAKKKQRQVRWGDSGLNCRILHKRTLHNLTVRDVAEGTGIHASLVSRAEHNFDLNLTTALKIAEFFECSVEELWSTLAARKNGAKR
jgi:transcriptional regulator with XRE-family HTH domain